MTVAGIDHDGLGSAAFDLCEKVAAILFDVV
jgi:hypothetical protein